MLRKMLLTVIAIAMSYVLTAVSGYVAYANSAERTEADLSLIVRFAMGPIIAVIVGSFVGFFSTKQPVAITLLGLTPWTIILLSSPHKPQSVAGWAYWFSPILFYLPLAGAAAWLTWRYRRKTTRQSALSS